MILTDKDKMPFGKFGPTGEGGQKEMANVPASYLLFLYDQWIKPGQEPGTVAAKAVLAYITDNLDVLKKEAKPSN